MSEQNALWIVAKREPYFRCGFEMKKTGLGIALSALTDDQVSRFKADPNLTVSEVTFDEAELADSLVAKAEAAHSQALEEARDQVNAANAAAAENAEKTTADAVAAIYAEARVAADAAAAAAQLALDDAVAKARIIVADDAALAAKKTQDELADAVAAVYAEAEQAAAAAEAEANKAKEQAVADAKADAAKGGKKGGK